MVLDMISAKCRFFSSVIFWFIFSFGSVWGGIKAFEEAFSFGARIVFSPYELLYPFSPVILSFPCVYLYMVLRYGENLAIKKFKAINRVFIYLLVGYIIFVVMFVVFYKNYLVSQGYFICSGNPRGWTIGMATEYVRSLSNCVK